MMNLPVDNFIPKDFEALMTESYYWITNSISFSLVSYEMLL